MRFTEATKKVPNSKTGPADQGFLRNIQQANETLYNSFKDKINIDTNLTRKLVSFQANKTRSYYKWYKFKEAFSVGLVEYFLKKYEFEAGRFLDPFAGTGTTLFSCAGMGYGADGIELLPIGQEIITSNILARKNNLISIINEIKLFIANKPWNENGDKSVFNILKITEDAYPENTHKKIERYLAEIEHYKPETKQLLLFALLCILESISYTRKDGQYLRWDYRSGRRNGESAFSKGKILSFDSAISSKVLEIITDLDGDKLDPDLFNRDNIKQATLDIRLFKGSCLDILPKFERDSYVGIITSPPYCNRYDYTRTYALEHAMLGVNEEKLLSLRQAMLSCTVENRLKELVKINTNWVKAVEICDKNNLLQNILSYLEYKKEKKELNNTGIARMVRGYFYELACVIQESSRVLKKGGYMIMVNDNVRYAGVSISVDLILSSIARELGLSIENILVLAQGKGNSSQQMGIHGKDMVRKCVYIWKKV